MARSLSSYGRGKPRFKQQPKILVICEDSKSSLNYLKDAAAYFRVEIVVKVSHIGRTDPLGIVEQGIKSQSIYDHVYCVIDRDNHQNFEEAIELGKYQPRLTIIVSYPCFEFWLLLHFKYSRKSYTAVGKHSAADSLIRDLKDYIENYDKGQDNIFSLLIGEKFDKARALAAKILDEAAQDQQYNPSTELHLLINKFEKLNTLQPL